MSKEEIEKLAKKYAEFTDSSPGGTAYIRAIVFCYTEWLLRTHCIVDRSKVVGEYEVAVLLQQSNNITDKDAGTIRQELMMSIFGKELFNEK